MYDEVHRRTSSVDRVIGIVYVYIWWYARAKKMIIEGEVLVREAWLIVVKASQRYYPIDKKVLMAAGVKEVITVQASKYIGDKLFSLKGVTKPMAWRWQH